MEVHSTLKWGLLEAVYSESLSFELSSRGIGNTREQLLKCFYKQHELEKTYKMDLVVDDIVVELKSVSDIQPAHRAQLFNYLQLTKYPVGLLLNFGSAKLQGERYGFIEETNECVLLDKVMEPYYQPVNWNVDK